MRRGVREAKNVHLHSHFVVAVGAGLWPLIRNVLSFPALCYFTVCYDQHISQLFLGQIKVRGPIGKGRKGTYMSRGNWFSA